MPDAEWDQSCITRHLAGEPDAFETLYTAHASLVKAYFLRVGFDSAMADDWTQQTFLQVFRAMARFDPARGGFHTWMRTIAANVARKHWRKRSAGEETFDPELAAVMLADETDPRDGPAMREELAALDHCAEHLPDDDNAIIRLRYVDGLTTRAMADQLAIPESTVRIRLTRARDKLLACMRGKGFFE